MQGINDSKMEELKGRLAVLYIRVSTKHDTQTMSYEQQVLELTQHAKDKGFTIVKVYKERVTATKNKGRDQFDELMDDIPKNKFEAIFFKDLSRSARNSEISQRLRRICLENRVGIFTICEGDNVEQDPLDYGIRTLMNEHYSQDISRKIKRTFYFRMREGEYLKGEAPYGYFVNNCKLFISKDGTPEIIKRIYNEYLDGYGVDSIARRLSKDGIIPPAKLKKKKNAGKYWHGTTIRKILENRAYCGDMEQGKEEKADLTSTKRLKTKESIIVKNTHEAIITKELFEEVQRQIRLRKTGPRPTPNIHLFTDILVCGQCGRNYWYRSTGKRYICGSYAKHGKFACAAKAIKEEDLKNIIVHDLHNILKDYKVDSKIEEELDGKIKSEIYRISSMKEILKNRLTNYEENKADLILAKISKEITSTEFNIASNKLDNDISLVKKNLKELNESNTEIDRLKIKKELKELLFVSENPKKLDRKILTRFIQKIIVHDKNSIEIVYNFKL